MNTKLDLLAGEIVFFGTTATPIASLTAVCDKHNIQQRWQPITMPRALLLAVESQAWFTRQHIARPGVANTVCVVRETIDENGNTYSDKAEQGRYRIGLNDIDPDAWQITTEAGRPISLHAAEQYRNFSQAGAIGGCLGNILVRYFRGIRVRPNGGGYFIPELLLTPWRAFAADLTVTTGIKVYQISAQCDATTAASVASAAAEDLRQRYEETLDAIAKVDQAIEGKPTQSRTDKRRELMRDLEAIKLIASTLDGAFQGITTLAADITADIDTQMALAVLATA